MTYEESLSWIHSRLKFGSRPGLIRIEALLERLGNPHHELAIIHVGGTNGKGSTVAFLRSLFQEYGLKVGTFTSPFLVKFNERMSIDEVPISDEDLVQYVKKIKPLVEELDEDSLLAGITEFEIITAMMFDYFKQERVDLAIVEVGLGGLMDSTNVVTPLASVITTIGLDHMDILGDTIEEIAYQKAGIIKNKKPVIAGKLPSEALEVIRKESKEKQSPLFVLGEQFVYDKSDRKAKSFTFKTNEETLKNLQIPLIGYHQFENASVAIETFLLLASHFDLTPTESRIQRALEQVSWPGRMEVVQQKPLIIIDGAHNEPAVDVMVDNLAAYYGDKKIISLFSAINTKDIRPMMKKIIMASRGNFYVTTFDYPTAVNLTAYHQLGIPDDHIFKEWWTGVDTLKKQLDENTVLIITGSLYFISNVRKYFVKETND